MDKPRFRFTAAPAWLALLLGVLLMPALNIVRVDARGMGHERTAPWKTRAQALGEAAIAVAVAWTARWRTRLRALAQHPYFQPACALALLAVVALFEIKALYATPLVLGTTLTEGTHCAEFLDFDRSVKRESITVLSGQNLSAGAVIGRVKLGIGRVSIPAVVPVGTANGTATAVFAGPEVQAGSYVVTCTAAATNAGTFSVVNPSGKALPNATVGVAYTSREINFTLNDGSSDFVIGDVFTFVVDTTAPTVIGGTGSGVMTALSLGPDAKPGRYQVINRVVIANGGDFEVIGPDGSSVGRFNWANSGSTAPFTSRQVNFTLSDATDYIANNYFDICVFNNLAGGKVVAWDPTTYDGRHRAEGVLFDAVDASAADTAGVIVTRDAIVIKGGLQWGAAITAAQKESAYLDLAARGVIARDSVA